MSEIIQIHLSIMDLITSIMAIWWVFISWKLGTSWIKQSQCNIHRNRDEVKNIKKEQKANQICDVEWKNLVW